MTNIKQREITAYRYSAFAFFALLGRIRFHSITLNEDGTGGVRLSGRRPRSADKIRKVWSCTVGGRQAVARITGEPGENSVVDLVALAPGITGDQVLAMNRAVSAAVRDFLSRPHVWETIETIAAQLLEHGYLLDKTVTTILGFGA
jgi:hypothetical protein